MKLQEYKKIISAAFADNTRRGYADWRDCGRLCISVVDNLERAVAELCEEKRYRDIFNLCNWTYVKWNNTDKDDSNGETQEFCGCAYEIWEIVYRDGEQELSHGKMLDVLLEHLDGKVCDFMEDTIYDFVLKRFKSKEELGRKEQFLSEQIAEAKKRTLENDWYEYSLAVKENYYVMVLADLKRPIEEIRELMNAGKRYSNIELLARIEMQYGNIDEAIALYKEQIESRPEVQWSDEPRKALMRIYRMQGNTAAYNEELYNMMIVHRWDDMYFMEYKALFSEEEWKKKWEALLAEFKDRLSEINAWLNVEGRYDIIMDNAEPDNENVIDIYGNKLFELYPQRCFKVLANAADRQVENSKNRRDYRRVAGTLRKIAAQPGGRALAAELAEGYREKYPRRTAMIDELKRF